jgi:hypothetical protein
MGDKGNWTLEEGKPGFIEIDPLLLADARKLLRKVQEIRCG